MFEISDLEAYFTWCIELSNVSQRQNKTATFSAVLFAGVGVGDGPGFGLLSLLNILSRQNVFGHHWGKKIP